MDVTGISVAVIILGRTPDLAWVHPHACLKVRMAYIDTFIKHSNDDRRITCTSEFIPSLLDLYVSILDELCRAKVAIVHKVPLVAKKRIIKG